MPPSQRDALQFPISDRPFLEPHLPPQALPQTSTDTKTVLSNPYPFTTLTFATSLDSQLSLSPGTQTHLSGPASKAMTHYLRSRHDAILIGVGTVIADNPSLNCRLEGVSGYGGPGPAPSSSGTVPASEPVLHGQPRPIIIDPDLRWEFSAEQSKILRLVREGKGRAPWVITSRTREDWPGDRKRVLEGLGGRFITVEMHSEKDGEGVSEKKRLDWRDVLRVLAKEGIKSVMVEGGGAVINSLLRPEYGDIISSVIVTIAPTWLGQGGVVVSPERRRDQEGNPIAAVRLRNVSWHPYGEDVVMCGKVLL